MKLRLPAIASIPVILIGSVYYHFSRNQERFINNELPIKLTSSAVPPSPDGTYSYDEMSFLFPHEPLRREMDRGKTAIEKMDVQKHPWKLIYLKNWLQQFLIPLIEDHHDAEELVFDPSYEQMGVEVPAKFKKDHASLIRSLGEMSSELSVLSAEPGKALSGFSKIRQQYNAMYDLMAEHLADEERFWPPIVRKYGEETFDKINDDMHKLTKKQKTGKLFLMSVFDSMGYEFNPGQSTHVTGDSRWCGTSLMKEKLVDKIPYLVRTLFFPKYNKSYQYYKTLINTVATGTKDDISLKN